MVNSGLAEADPALYSDSGGLSGLVASLRVSLDGMSQRMDRDRDERLRINTAVYAIPDIPIGQITASTGAGSLLIQPELAGPKTGNVWFVTRIGFQGLSAGQVDVFYMDPNGTLVDSLVFPTSGALSKFYSGGALPVRPGQYLVFKAGASWAGTTTINLGVSRVAADYEGLYLL